MSRLPEVYLRLQYYSSPLFDLLKSSFPKQLAVLNAERQASLQELQKKLSNTSILELPQPNMNYELHTDASAYQAGCASFQIYPNKSLRPVQFWYRTINPAE